MSNLSFFIPCNPPKSTAQASHRIMKRRDGTQFVGKFAKSKGKRTQDELLLLLQPYRPEKPLEGPVALSVRWTYPWRKSESKKNKLSGRLWCDTRPDCDNLLKLLQDCMTRLAFWNDDSQVAFLKFRKMWGDNNGIHITVSDEINKHLVDSYEN